MTLHTSPSPVSYAVPLMSILVKKVHVIKRFDSILHHCSFNHTSIKQHGMSPHCVNGWDRVQLRWRRNRIPKYHQDSRADSRLVPSQWETSLQSNAVSHWLGASLESGLILGLRPANEKCCYKVTPSLIGWAQIGFSLIITQSIFSKILTINTS